MRSGFGFLLFLFAATLPCPLPAQSSEPEIGTRLVGKPLYLRGFWVGDKLEFDGAGVPVGRPAIGSFTVTGMRVERVSLGAGKLKLEGTRAGIRFVNGLPERVAIPDKAGEKAERIRVEIEAPAGGDYGKALDAVFATTLEEMVPSLPVYWQAYAREHLVHGAQADGRVGDVAEDYLPEDVETPGATDVSGSLANKTNVRPRGVLGVGGGVKAPVPIRMPDPRFSDAARASRVSGAVLVYLWVDQAGMPTHVRILRPMGLGLDERAVDAVSHYLFKPALRGGVPVTVEMNVEVNFQIF